MSSVQTVNTFFSLRTGQHSATVFIQAKNLSECALAIGAFPFWIERREGCENVEGADGLCGICVRYLTWWCNLKKEEREILGA
jgi:hypothetical protein